MGEPFDDHRADLIADLLGVPTRRAQQSLHRIRAGVTGVLGQPPAVLPLGGRQQPGDVVPGGAPRLHPAERRPDAAHHPIDGLIPPGRVDPVYAMARGHPLIILAPHKPGMITRWPLCVTPPR